MKYCSVEKEIVCDLHEKNMIFHLSTAHPRERDSDSIKLSTIDICTRETVKLSPRVDTLKYFTATNFPRLQRRRWKVFGWYDRAAI